MLDFSERLLSFWYILACTRTVSVFVNISLLSHARNFFSWTVIDSTTRVTHMHVALFPEFVIHHFHARSFTNAYTQYRHEFIFTFNFSFPSVSLANLGPDSAFIETTLHNLGKEIFSYLSKNVYFYPTTILHDCFSHFWGTMTTGQEKCTMQSLILQPLLAEITHCAISKINNNNGLWIAKF